MKKKTKKKRKKASRKLGPTTPRRISRNLSTPRQTPSSGFGAEAQPR